MLHDPPLLFNSDHAKIMDGVFHETFVIFITVEVYISKDSNLPCCLEVQRGHKHRQTFFQTIYSNPPEGGGSNII